ncbi:16S rRNA (cytosine1402-N4)-methyltransferase [Planktotalea frisia]|jgi:16S rRNA (cytosine1402-N4)-methyltransferase|uniref:Ribosomal RNA small subunit methyltransferase H n=1 Tax=Planktotalea frisia TaxID=696762 RepID=A0A1L9P285_9RHOB|nr:16S rRNA (cytosine(1402)-N(4))-methyltransferase RsmH [Planktotalea frisia]OJI95606.1 ribosomal RNA small subunit methyltransferase H [Planktotalea frisia]PZX33386.1 16S rRNA (cytosine1402-N4)-methyltransferase [Planktotalea frisia]
MTQAATTAPHIPVLLDPILKAADPISGRWLDGTFGAGGYTRALLDAGADSVIAVDRDPLAFEMATSWAGQYGERLIQQRGVFSDMAEFAQDLDGVVLDLGVSSMQLDIAERGFSFMRDGPLDMRMGQDGQSAADIVNEYEAEEIAEILYNYGEERASRRIARAILEMRAETPITTTLQLAGLIEKCLPRKKPGQSHPATRSFQALRIAVNNEYGELYQGLMAAERALAPGGLLAVVSFHSVEDRMAKRFLQSRAGTTGNPNRFAPQVEVEKPAFELLGRKAITASEEELEHNVRARSAKLRLARRTDAPAGDIAPKVLGMPMLRRDR